MKFCEYPLHDLGYVNPDTGISLTDISGLSNKVEFVDGKKIDERFVHAGFSGYPSTHLWLVDTTGKCLAAFEGDAEEGGSEIAQAEVVALLIAEYGYPENVVIGADGIPVLPGA